MCTPVGRRARASQGHEVGAAVSRSPLDRACWVGRGGRGGRGATRAPRPRTRPSRSTSTRRSCRPSTDMETALDAGTPVIHPELGDNLASSATSTPARSTRAFADADAVVEATFDFGRHTGVTLEPRSILADYNRGDGKLTVYHAHPGAAHDAGRVRASTCGLPEAHVRVICNGRRRLASASRCTSTPTRWRPPRSPMMLRPAGQVRRRPAGVLRHRHPRARPPRQGAHGRRRKRRRHHAPSTSTT